MVGDFLYHYFKLMKIYIGLQGTCWEGKFPKIGTLNPGIGALLQKLQAKGHEIIVNVPEIETDLKTVKIASKYLSSLIGIPIEINDTYMFPLTFRMKAHIEGGFLFIDKNSIGTPVIDNMIDVYTIDLLMVQYKVYPAPPAKLEFDIQEDSDKEYEITIAPEELDDDILAEYEIVCWPDCQHLMEYDWFYEESLLLNSIKQLDEYVSSAYLVPKERMKELKPE